MTNEELKVLLGRMKLLQYDQYKNSGDWLRYTEDLIKAIRQLAREVPCDKIGCEKGMVRIQGSDGEVAWDFCSQCSGSKLKYNLEG